MILGRIDVARRPAHVGAERLQGLDQHRGLDRHVQRAGDARAAQRLSRGEFLANGHQARHLGLGDGDFLAAPGSKLEVGDFEVGEVLDIGCSVHSVTPSRATRNRGRLELRLVIPLGIAVQRAPLRRIPSLAGEESRRNRRPQPVATLLGKVHFIVRSGSWAIRPSALSGAIAGKRRQTPLRLRAIESLPQTPGYNSARTNETEPGQSKHHAHQCAHRQ